MSIDLKKEHKASVERPRYKYSLISKGFFLSMDLLTGKKTTLGKVKLLEILACIPYRAYESRQYSRLTRGYASADVVAKGSELLVWGRESQDSEFQHLLIVNEKMKEDKARDPWYLTTPIPHLMVASYIALSRVLAWISMRRAILFNAEFEDHAEHVYAQFVTEHPEWEDQPVRNEKVKEYGDMATWADVFRRIALDERDHMNNSFRLCGKPECIAKYDGMPDHQYLANVTGQ